MVQEKEEFELTLKDLDNLNNEMDTTLQESAKVSLTHRFGITPRSCVPW